MVNTDAHIDYSALGIAELIKSRSLAVPLYQRSYSWVTEAKRSSGSSTADVKFQVVEFWSDLISSFSNQNSYFLGTIVLAQGPRQRLMIIDGQQRLATTSLLLAAIRNRCRAGGEMRSAESTQHTFLATYNKAEKRDQPKLILNTDDNHFYEKHVVEVQVVEPDGHSQRLVKSAYDYLQQRIDEFAAANGSNWEPKLTELEEWLTSGVKVVVITVPTEADAFLIFETLNDRGADLTIADLLKNYLFSQAGDARLNEVQENWVRILSNLGLKEVGNQEFTTFARHLLSSQYGLVRERELYGKLKSVVSNSAAAVEFSGKLQQTSKLYYALSHSDSDFWSDYPTKLASAAEVISDLQIVQYRPLILAALEVFSKDEAQRFMTTLVSWSVRMLSQGGLGGGFAEMTFCGSAVAIRKGEITTTAELLLKSKIGELVPSDDVFVSNFKEWTPTPRVSRYLLRALELTQRGELEPELVVNMDVDVVNLEHILPKNAKAAEWPAFAAESRKMFVDRLGNHVLLQKTPNWRIGNKPWSVKQPILAGSALHLTSETANTADWNETAIISRQDQLAKLALKCWPRDPVA